MFLVITLAISIIPSFIYAETTVINFEELIDLDRGFENVEFRGDELVDQHIRFSTPDRALILMNVIPPDSGGIGYGPGFGRIQTAGTVVGAGVVVVALLIMTFKK